MFWDGICSTLTHACPLGSDVYPVCLTTLPMPFIGSSLPTTTSLQSITGMTSFLWGQQEGTVYLLNQVTLLICERLGIPVAFEKLEGPFTQISFLGIVLDSEAHQLSLPQLGQAARHPADGPVLVGVAQVS